MDKSKGSLFYAYRYFIVHNGQQSIFDNQQEHNTDKNKVHALVTECIEKKKIAYDIDDRKHVLLCVKKYNNDITLFKFSKDFPQTRYQFDDNTTDIVESRESNFPYIYVFIDTKQQLVCLEHRTTVFSTIGMCKKAFSAFVERYIHDLNYTFSMDEISDTSSFWDSVNSAEKIYQLQLNLRSPNLFGGIFETNSFLKKVKEAFNNDECVVNLKNSAGNLHVTKEAMDDPLKYVSSGGGIWRLTVTKKGRKKRTTISSKENGKTVEILDFEENYSLFGGNDIIKEIQELGQIADTEDKDS